MGTKHCFNCYVYLHSSVPSYFPSTVSLWIMEIVSLHHKSLNISIFDVHCFLAQLSCCVKLEILLHDVYVHAWLNLYGSGS